MGSLHGQVHLGPINFILGFLNLTNSSSIFSKDLSFFILQISEKSLCKSSAFLKIDGKHLQYQAKSLILLFVLPSFQVENPRIYFQFLKLDVNYIKNGIF